MSPVLDFLDENPCREGVKEMRRRVADGIQITEEKPTKHRRVECP